MFYLFELKPFNEKVLNYSNLFSELGICVFFCIFSLLLFDIGEEGKNDVDTALFYTLNGIMVIQMVASLMIFSKTIIEKIKQKQKNNSIVPESALQGNRFQYAEPANSIITMKGVCNEKPSISYEEDSFLFRMRMDKKKTETPKRQVLDIHFHPRNSPIT
jgi:hypothetical protein